MTNYQSRNDLDSSVQGFHPNFSVSPQSGEAGIVSANQTNTLVLLYLKETKELIAEIKELTRKSRNLLWQIDEKLSNPKNEPEYEVHDLEDK